MDETNPTLYTLPITDDPSTVGAKEFVYIEAGGSETYTDANDANISLYNSSTDSIVSSQSVWNAFDTTDGSLTNDIRIIAFVDLNRSIRRM